MVEVVINGERNIYVANYEPLNTNHHGFEFK